jgi:hypothetical protein
MKRQPRLTKREQRALQAKKMPKGVGLISCERRDDGYYVVITNPQADETLSGPFESIAEAYDTVRFVCGEVGIGVLEGEDALKNYHGRN